MITAPQKWHGLRPYLLVVRALARPLRCWFLGHEWRAWYMPQADWMKNEAGGVAMVVVRHDCKFCPATIYHEDADEVIEAVGRGEKVHPIG